MKGADDKICDWWAKGLDENFFSEITQEVWERFSLLLLNYSSDGLLTLSLPNATVVEFTVH